MNGRNGKSGDDGDERAGRLARALRDNLRRRKAQARARRGGAGIAPGSAPEPPINRPETGPKPDDETNS